MGNEMDVLIQAMSDKDLQDLKVKYAGNKSIEDLVTGILATRNAEADKAKIKVEFETKIAKMVKLPAPPEGIYNIYMQYGEVAVDDTSKPQTEVEIEGVKTMRYPVIKVYQWTVTTNKAMEIKAKSAGKAGVSNKRAIEVFKMDKVSMKVNSIGKFVSGSKACEALKIDPMQGSANLALTKAGYIVQPYEGELI